MDTHSRKSVSIDLLQSTTTPQQAKHRGIIHGCAIQLLHP